MKAADSTAEWVRMGAIRNLTFIGKDVLCYGTGCFLKFINIVTGETFDYTANIHSVNGEGIKCIAGHPSSGFFAYAECCSYPNIYVVHFPTCEKVSVLSTGAPFEGYSNISFSELSLLLTLGDIPSFTITVWNWRNKEKVAQKLSSIHYSTQYIRCSYTRPLFCLQMARGTTYINIWDVSMCCKTFVLTEHVIKMPKTKPSPLTDCIWTYDNIAYFIDTMGCIYSLNEDYCLEKIVDFTPTNEDERFTPCLTWYKGMLTAFGPTKEIRMYSYKKTNNWICDQSFVPSYPLKNLLSTICNKIDYLVGQTTDHEIVTFNKNDDGTWATTGLTDFQSNFTDFCMVFPTGQYIAALRHNTSLDVYEVKTGQMVKEYELGSVALVVRENPEFPYLAVGFENGRVKLVSLYDLENIQVIASFHLCDLPISSVYFYERGKVFMCGNLENGLLFILKGVPGTDIHVVQYIDTKVQILDCMLVASGNCFRVYVIPLTFHKYMAGDKLIRYCVVTNKIVNIKEYSFENPDFMYYKICPSFKKNRDRTFYVLRYNSKKIYQVEIQRGDNVARVVASHPTGHQLMKFGMRMTKYHAITWGVDGFVIIRDNTFKRVAGMSLVHHRIYWGVRKTYMDPLEEYIITLGRDQNLVCSNMHKKHVDEERRKEIYDVLSSKELAIMFSRPTKGFEPQGALFGKSWLEVTEMKRFADERKTSKKERNAILTEFRDIQTELKRLLDENMSGPENEKIDMLDFNLDKPAYKEKLNKNTQECDDTELYMKRLAEAYNRVYDWIKVNCWDGMDVMSRRLWSFFGNMMVTKYALLPFDNNLAERVAYHREVQKIERIIAQGDNFFPWIPLTTYGLHQLMLQRPRIYEQPHQPTYDLKQGDVDTQIALLGTCAPLFSPVISHTRQRRLSTFYTDRSLQAFVEMEVYNLKVKFNASFDELVMEKGNIITNIKEKNARLRYIISEINHFSANKIDIEIEDPSWQEGEHPENVIIVEDHEISLKPYISPSTQALMDAKEAEAERIRLLMMTDNFRENTLMKMMNGVLEIRWEDELKIDVPIPKCLSEKDPEEYTEEDLRTIKEYEEKVSMLNAERHRYKKMLMVEYGKTANYVRDAIKKFNKKVLQMLALKASMDSGNNHENLMINRERFSQSRRIQMNHEEERITKEISHNEMVMNHLENLIEKLSETIKECKNTFENFLVREKMLEKAFKRDMSETLFVVQEQGMKLYRKRPKMNFRGFSSSTGLMSLAKCIVSKTKPNMLVPEYLDYLRALDTLDMFVGLPPIIDELTFATICRHRRLKIEYELKVKAMTTEIHEAEFSIGSFEKRLDRKKAQHANLQDELASLRSRRLELMHNKQIQFVFRCGSIEVPLSGEYSDFEDAVLVKRAEVIEINNKIVEAGDLKLTAMKANMKLRSDILQLEWEHKKYKMHMEDFRQQLIDIESIKVTLEMLNYLKMRKKGITASDQVDYEWQVQRLRMHFENDSKEKQEEYARLKKRIKALKESNKDLDQQISDINVDICEFRLEDDIEFEEVVDDVLKSRMKTFIKRRKLVQDIQNNHNDMLVLQTELELLRLRTYPTFHYKLL